MAFSIRARVDGLQDILRKLDELPKKLRNKFLRRAVSDAAKLILWSARARTPRRFGILKKSLGRKVKVYRRSGTMVAIVGARVGFKQQVGTRVKASRASARYPKAPGDPIYADPTKYLHLVELGTARSKGVHMLRDALQVNKSAIRDKMRDALSNAIADAQKGGR